MPEALWLAADHPEDKSVKTMKAWVARAPTANPLEGMKIEAVQIPEPGPLEALIKIRYAGLNPADAMRLNIPHLPFPVIAGFDLSGDVVALGAQVSTELGLHVGDRVCCWSPIHRPYGTYAEFSIVDARVLIKIPAALSYPVAAGIPCVAFTAYIALHRKLAIAAGQTIVITAGSGGVGYYAIKFAKLAGLRVISSCSTKNVALVKGLGADLVVDYTKDDLAASVKAFTHGVGADCALDLVSPVSAEAVGLTLRFGGALCHLSGTVTTSNPAYFLNEISTHYVMIPGWHAKPDSLREVGKAVMALIESGAVAALEPRVVAFEEAAKALQQQATGHVAGKTVIAVAS